MWGFWHNRIGHQRRNAVTWKWHRKHMHKVYLLASMCLKTISCLQCVIECAGNVFLGAIGGNGGGICIDPWWRVGRDRNIDLLAINYSSLLVASLSYSPLFAMSWINICDFSLKSSGYTLVRFLNGIKQQKVSVLRKWFILSSF